ncbi:DNA_helicase [Hexamita inflata]|uniref:Putative n=1 Tax=Hexamita inflata TaxID=28002 RepID=A0AA86PRG5_9EUKA|nr:DNA helicase [Hexamita inflata]
MQNQPQHEKFAINYPKFVDRYDNVESYQKQYSTALTIENQIQIFCHANNTEITRNLTIIEEDDPVAALQNAYEEEDEEDTASQTARIQLAEKLWGTVIPEQKGKLLFWYERQLQTVGVVVTDNEFITVDQSFIQAFKGELLIRQIVRKQNAETRFFEEIVQTQSKLKENVHVYLIITEDSIPFKRMQEVIQNCSDSHKVISQIIRGQPEEATTQVQSDYIQNLNPAQNLACLKASQKNITLIQGCPGGGKTTTAAYIIKNAMSKHKRILVCAGTDVAADNLCMAMKKIGIMSTRVCAISREQNKVANQQYSARVHPDIMDREIHMQCLNQLQPILQNLNQKINEYGLATPNDKLYQQFFDAETGFKKNDFDAFKQYFIQPPRINFINIYSTRNEVKDKAYELYRITYSKIFQESQIIVSTCSTCGDHRFKNKNGYTQFDMCLLDESPQCIEPEQLIPIIHVSQKLVLVGDQKQLGPVIQSQNLKKSGFGLSLFQRLLNCKFPVTILNIQYRMHPALIEYPNIKFYDGIISSGVQASDRLLPVRENNAPIVQDHFPSQMINVQNGQEENSQSTSYLNRQECEETVVLVNKLLNTYHITESDISIITPYAAQRHLIRNKLREKNITAIEVSSVDEFQGRENKIIIFSFVRSIKVGFTNDVKRLNVSLTRAQYQLYIICNVDCLYKDRELNELVKFYRTKKAIINNQ